MKSGNIINSLIFLVFTIILHVSCERGYLPVLRTLPVKEIDLATAVSGGVISDEGDSRIIECGICWGRTINPTVTDCDSSIYCESDSLSYECRMSGLKPGTRYHVRAFAFNSTGSSYGDDMSFITRETPTESSLPLCITLGAVIDSLNLTGLNHQNLSGSNSYFYQFNFERNSPVLFGAVLLKNLPAQVYFEYGLTKKYGQKIEAHATGITGNQLTCFVSRKIQLMEYTPVTTYHFRIMAENINGTSYGEDRTMIIHPDWSYYTERCATNISGTGATLSGELLYSEPDTEYYSHPLSPAYVEFNYGTTTDYGQSLRISLTGRYPKIISANITGLTPGTLYHYNIWTNPTSMQYSRTGTHDLTFLTVENAPSCVTQHSNEIRSESPHYILLRGDVIANDDLPVEVIFELGLTTAYGINLPAIESPVSVNPETQIKVTAKITRIAIESLGLKSGSLYHYRLKVTNRYATVYGNDMNFDIPSNW